MALCSSIAASSSMVLRPAWKNMETRTAQQRVNREREKSGDEVERRLMLKIKMKSKRRVTSRGIIGENYIQCINNSNQSF